LAFDLSQLKGLPSPFYRVVAKVVVFDEQRRMLMLFTKDGNIELPGGGWEHDETFEECLQRESLEEMGLRLKNISPIWFTARGASIHGWRRLLLIAQAELDSTDFELGEEYATTRFVTKEELLSLPYRDVSDDFITEFVDLIWPTEG